MSNLSTVECFMLFFLLRGDHHQAAPLPVINQNIIQQKKKESQPKCRKVRFSISVCECCWMFFDCDSLEFEQQLLIQRVCTRNSISFGLYLVSAAYVFHLLLFLSSFSLHHHPSLLLPHHSSFKHRLFIFENKIIRFCFSRATRSMKVSPTYLLFICTTHTHPHFTYTQTVGATRTERRSLLYLEYLSVFVVRLSYTFKFYFRLSLYFLFFLFTLLFRLFISQAFNIVVLSFLFS